MERGSPGTGRQASLLRDEVEPPASQVTDELMCLRDRAARGGQAPRLAVDGRREQTVRVAVPGVRHRNTIERMFVK